MCVVVTEKGGEQLKQQVSPGIIAVTVVVVLGLIGAIAYMTMGKKQDVKSALNPSNPNYQKYMSGSGSGGGSGAPNSGGSPSHMGSGGGMGSPGSTGSPNH